jgi:hypothetical protein
MPKTGEAFYGWQIEAEDAVIVEDEEITVLDKRDEGDPDDPIELIAYDEFGDVRSYFVLPDVRYDEWGY